MNFDFLFICYPRSLTLLYLERLKIISGGGREIYIKIYKCLLLFHKILYNTNNGAEQATRTLLFISEGKLGNKLALVKHLETTYRSETTDTSFTRTRNGF